MSHYPTKTVLLLGAALCLVASSAPLRAENGASPVKAGCGDGLLEAGETCATCAADCAAKPCAPGEKRVKFSLRFTPPEVSLSGDVRSFTPVAATILVSYRSDRLSLPGVANDKSVGARVRGAGSPSATLFSNDLDYAVRVIATDTRKLQSELATVEFDTCEGTPDPLDGDLRCVVEACAGHGGPLADCYCEMVVVPDSTPLAAAK